MRLGSNVLYHRPCLMLSDLRITLHWKPRTGEQKKLQLRIPVFCNVLLCSWEFTSLDILKEGSAFVMEGWYLLDASKRRDMLKYALLNVTSQKTRIINTSAVETWNLAQILLHWWFSINVTCYRLGARQWHNYLWLYLSWRSGGVETEILPFLTSSHRGNG
jgi:hypothetical protein